MASSAPAYALTRDHVESTRLDSQHHLLTQAWCNGELLHPCIALEGGRSSTVAIADVGTGTGVWLKELKKKHQASGPSQSSIYLVGFDISDAHFLKADGDGPSFVVHDALVPFPDRFRGVFDVVHLRLLVYWLRSEDLKTVIDNILPILKPDGYIEWFESDVNDWWSEPSSDDIQKAIDLINQERSRQGRVQYIPSALLQALGLPLVLPVQHSARVPIPHPPLRLLALERKNRQSISSDTEITKQTLMHQTIQSLLQAVIKRKQNEIADRTVATQETPSLPEDTHALEEELNNINAISAAIEQGRQSKTWKLDGLVIRVVVQKVEGFGVQ